LDQLPRELHDRDEKILKKSEHISSISQTLQGSEARIENANLRVQEAAERRKELMDAYEKQREQIEKKSEHIARLTKSLNELHQHLKVTRSQYQKRATAMLAAAATLTEEVRLSRLDAPMADAGEAENSETESADQPAGPKNPILNKRFWLANSRFERTLLSWSQRRLWKAS